MKINKASKKVFHTLAMSLSIIAGIDKVNAATNITLAGSPYLASALGTTVNPVFQGGTLEVDGNSSYTFNFTLDNSTTNTIDAYNHRGTFSGVFSNATSSPGNLVLTATTTGTTTLTGANTYTGTTTISGGVLVIGTGGSITSSSAITDNASLIFSSTGPQSYANVISGTGSLIKTATGTLTLTAANTYTGGTAISGGFLALASSGAIGSTGNITFSGGTLQFSASNTTDYSSRFTSAANQIYSFDTNGQNITLASDLISSLGSLKKFGTGTLTLTGTNTFIGASTINAGTLQIGSGGLTGQLKGNITDNSALIFNRSGSYT